MLQDLVPLVEVYNGLGHAVQRFDQLGHVGFIHADRSRRRIEALRAARALTAISSGAAIRSRVWARLVQGPFVTVRLLERSQRRREAFCACWRDRRDLRVGQEHRLYLHCCRVMNPRVRGKSHGLRGGLIR